MIYLPDTNVWIKLLNSGDSQVKDRFNTVKADEIKLCSMVKAELIFGAYKSSKKEENLVLLKKLFVNYESYSFDDTVIESYAKVRNDLQKLGTPICPYDLIIAATAIAFNAILVTHNIREFKRVTGLVLEDWELP